MVNEQSNQSVNRMYEELEEYAKYLRGQGDKS